MNGKNKYKIKNLSDIEVRKTNINLNRTTEESPNELPCIY